MLLSKVIQVLALSSALSAAQLSEEADVKLSEQNENSVVDVSMVVRYEHKHTDGDKTEYYPSAYFEKNFKLQDSDLADSLNLNRDERSYLDLRNEIVKIISGKDLVNALISGDKFDRPISEYEGFKEFKDEKKMMEFSSRNFYNHNKLISAILPFYVLIGLIALVFLFNRSKLKNQNCIQFSPMSKVLFSFLIFRFIYDLAYLTYLILYQFFGKFQSKNFLYFFLTFDQVLGLIIFHCGITFFVQGYLTVSENRKKWFDKSSLVMTFLYFISVSCIKIYLRVIGNEDDNSFDIYVLKMKDQNIHLGYFMIFFTFTIRLLVLVLVCKNFKVTYLESGKNYKFLSSFLTVIIMYFLSGYIKFPLFTNIHSISEVLKQELIGESYLEYIVELMPVPEIIQIITCFRLIYIWRDDFSEKKKESA